MKPSQPIVPSRATASRNTLRRMTLLLLTGALTTSCGGDERSILVRVNGVPAGTPSLRATSILDGKTDVGMDLLPPLDSFGLKLPASNSGTLTLNVSAQDTDKCKSASGTLDIELGSKNYQEVTITLNAITPVQCSVLFNPDGDGSATFTPAGKSCGPGCLDFDKGSTVQLKVAGGPNSYGGAAYSKAGIVNCDLSRSSCTLTMTTRAQLTLAYHNRICSNASWCWYGPSPQSNAIFGIWGSSPNDVWAVGRNGAAIHFDGQSWTAPKFPTANSLRGVWGNGADSYWAVGDAGTILHFDGMSWQPQTSGTSSRLVSIWGSSVSDLWAVGDAGTVLHSTDGQSWMTASSGTMNDLYRVYGSAADNVWIAGDDAVLKRSGNGFAPVTVSGGAGVVFNDVWTSGPNDVWVVGEYSSLLTNSTVFRFDGSKWSSTRLPTPTGTLSGFSVAGSSSGDVWVGTNSDGLYRFTTGLSSPAKQDATGNTTANTYTLWSSGPGEVIFGTAGGNLVRRGINVGTAYAAAPIPGGAVPTIAAVSGTSSNDVTILSKDPSQLLSHFDGKVWSVAPNIPPESSLSDLWVAPTGEVWTTADQGRTYRNGVRVPNGLSGTDPTYAVGGSSTNDVWASGRSGGSAALVHYTGGALFQTPSSYGGVTPPIIRAIWARNPSEAFFVGDSGAIFRWNGTAIGTKMTLPPGVTTGETFYGVGGGATGDVWIVGTNGTALRYDGISLTKVATVTTRTLTSVWASGPNDVWIAGEGGTVRHWNGTSLDTPNIGLNAPVIVAPDPPSSVHNISRLWGSSATDIWATGISGLLVRYMPGK